MPRRDKLTVERRLIRFGASVTVPAMPWERGDLEMAMGPWPCEPVTYRRKRRKKGYHAATRPKGVS